MAMYTYINDQDIDRWSKATDKDINDLLQQVRAIDDRYMIYEYTIIKKHWFKKTEHSLLYSLRVRDGYEARIINFAQDHECSINDLVTKSYMMTYLFGLLTGFNLSKQQKEK